MDKVGSKLCWWLRCRACFKAFPVFQIRLCTILFPLFVFMSYWTEADAVARRCSVKKVFLEIWQNSQENTCACQSLYFNKVAGLKSATLLKWRLWHAQVFSCEFCQISKSTFFHTFGGCFCRGRTLSNIQDGAFCEIS